MKRILQILLGFVLILVLAYLSFLEVSEKIKEDLLAKTKIGLTAKGIVGISAEVEGEGLALTRTIILRGSVDSKEERRKIALLVNEIEGVLNVENKISVITKPYEDSTIVEVPVVKAIVPMVEKVLKVVDVIEKPKREEPQVVMSAEKKVEELKELPKSTATVNVNIEVEKKSLNAEMVMVPVVPNVIKPISKIPSPIEVTKLPMVVEAEKAIISEENKKRKIEGVE
ncbi:MAG: Unknown protein [uncultured Sulfurovum sp.]|uniref:BON domain-containing protein n=1 Tax=uncultured Sulfurovum sp. TaxID=269237 RepID=A0A6S6T9D0_9BACT|nr:MAG: Unknown protein [uncultured Sulfurovum sp.]